MAVSLEKVLGDLQLMNQRLKARDSDAESLLQQAQSVHMRLTTMQRYQEEVLTLTEIANRSARRTGPGGSSHRQLLLCMAAENKQVEQLRSENSTLRNSLDEHQTVLELIMTKYRSQMSKLMQENRVTEIVESTLNADPGFSLEELTAHAGGPASAARGKLNGLVVDFKLHDPDGPESTPPSMPLANNVREQAQLRQSLSTLAQMAHEVTEQSDQYATELEEELQRLRVENTGLRQMLSISAARQPAVVAVNGLLNDEAGGTRPQSQPPQQTHLLLQQYQQLQQQRHMLTAASPIQEQLAGGLGGGGGGMTNNSSAGLRETMMDHDADDMSNICSALNSLDVRLAEVEAATAGCAGIGGGEAAVVQELSDEGGDDDGDGVVGGEEEGADDDEDTRLEEIALSATGCEDGTCGLGVLADGAGGRLAVARFGFHRDVGETESEEVEGEDEEEMGEDLASRLHSEIMAVAAANEQKGDTQMLGHPVGGLLSAPTAPEADGPAENDDGETGRDDMFRRPPLC